MESMRAKIEEILQAQHKNESDEYGGCPAVGWDFSKPGAPEITED